ncbi:MAG: acetyl-CoA hydrolase/transferase family protein [Acidimicrobiales bacterium]
MSDEIAPIPRPKTGGRAGASATMAEAMAALADCRRIYVTGGCGAPSALVEGLAAERQRWDRLEIVADYLLAPLAIFDHPGEPFHLLSLQPSRAVDGMRAANALSNVSSSLRHFAKLTRSDGPLSIDAALVHVSPPGPDGRFSLGASVGTPVEVMANAPLVIAQVNPQMPYTFGAAELDRDEIDLLVDVDHALVELPASSVDATAEQIGSLVAAEIPDHSVIQFGVGAIPKAVLDSLHNHRDLGVHGGMIGDEVAALYASGALTGRAKPTWPGKMVVGAVLGGRTAFEFADRNPDLLMVPASISHGPTALGALDRFVAINSAVEVALDGSINAETAAGRVLSGPGGQPDYLIGAAEAAHGISIIALPSTGGRDGGRSRIVSALDTGTSVTGLRSFADLVITEHGVARLKGRSFAERAEALKAIADPQHQESLE